MTDQPYTDADVMAEAARQHRSLTEDPYRPRTGDRMEYALVPSTDDGLGGSTWGGLLPVQAEYDAARNEIHRHLAGAADLSGWAVAMGADGLVPAEHPVNLRHQGRPVVRAHLAFPPHLTETQRDDIAEAVAEGIAAAVGLTREP